MYSNTTVFLRSTSNKPKSIAVNSKVQLGPLGSLTKMELRHLGNVNGLFRWKLVTSLSKHKRAAAHSVNDNFICQYFFF